MKIIKRIAIVFLVLNLARLLEGCCDCRENYLLFDFTSMSVSNIDNSGPWAVPTDADTMFSEAVAFRVQVSDSSGYIYASALQPSAMGFSSCQACKCEDLFRCRQQIVNISIITLYDIAGDIPANSGVTQYFYFGLQDYSSPGDLYVSWNEFSDSMTGKIYDRMMESFSLYLTKNIENDSARFMISAELSDGRTLSDTTALIHIINQSAE